MGDLWEVFEKAKWSPIGWLYLCRSLLDTPRGLLPLMGRSHDRGQEEKGGSVVGEA